MAIEINIYTDSKIYDITNYTTQYNVQLSVMSPYESAQVEVRVPYNLEHEILPFKGAAYDLNSWLVIKEESVAIFWGRVTDTSYGLVVEGEEAPALVAGDVIRLTCQSWVSVLQQGQISLSGKLVGAPNHIFNLKSWAAKLKGILSAPFQNRNVGGVLRKLFNYFAPNYRLPKTLAGGTDLSAIPVVYDKRSSNEYASERTAYHRSVFGLAINVAQNPLPRGTAWNMITSCFDIDPNLVELFSSLEPAIAKKGTLTNALGATPVLIYRMKPFDFGLKHPPEAASEEVHHALETNLYIRAGEILNVGLSVSDSDRVNAVYVDTPLNESRGVEAFGLVGRPRLDLDDIDKAGLRMYRGQWPFFPTGKLSKNTSLNNAVQYVVDLCYLTMINTHLYTRGTITIHQRLDLKAGQWVKLELKHPITQHDLFCYIENISHSTRVLVNGDIERRSTLSIVRGFYSGEDHHEATI